MVLVDAAVRSGRPPSSVVGVTGLPLTPEVRRLGQRGVLDRLPMFDRITPDGVAERIHLIGYGQVGEQGGCHPAARAAVRDIRVLLDPAGASD